MVYLPDSVYSFNIIITEKFLTHTNIKYTELYLILSLMYVKQIHQFLSSIKKMHTKENWFFFSASRCSSTVPSDG